ncbi:hypothetical protein PAPYR_11724 [Paratrimastix pyriformis]|uniref:Uncharacterized protein n=1 Tax=Paratrimastix pyriformis TaxID=342808 RepID=A0ABQ8U383_9EUKA|nr:hypothetical protein PAPYR_11724 [Paratrimastix pyriformis]
MISSTILFHHAKVDRPIDLRIGFDKGIFLVSTAVLFFGASSGAFLPAQGSSMIILALLIIRSWTSYEVFCRAPSYDAIPVQDPRTGRMVAAPSILKHKPAVSLSSLLWDEFKRKKVAYPRRCPPRALLLARMPAIPSPSVAASCRGVAILKPKPLQGLDGFWTNDFEDAPLGRLDEMLERLDIQNKGHMIVPISGDLRLFSVSASCAGSVIPYTGYR